MATIEEKDTEAITEESSVSMPEEPETEKTHTPMSLRKYIIICSIFGVLVSVSAALFGISAWYKANYYLQFKELLYVITGPIEGTGDSMVKSIVLATVPWAVIAAVVFTAAAILIRNLKSTKKIVAYIGRIGLSVSCIFIAGSLVFTVHAFRMLTYFENMREKTTIYEDYYVDPAKTAITAEGKTKNLIYIYVESLETTHTDKANGGILETNLLPSLTALAKENIFFSNLDNGKLGGFYPLAGSNWTVAALLASSSGIPFSFSVGNNNMDNAQSFAPGMTNLGDILNEKGYNQEFICGSDAEFGGRETLFTQHGEYELYDLNTARKNGDLPSPIYHNDWWGFEDKYLFEIAQKEATRLANEEKPFNLTLLTVDTHPQEGYICDLCENTYDSITANVISCTDRQVSNFVNWCKNQPFYEDTVIIITGDHPRMDNALTDGCDWVRTMYNCFINSAVQPNGNTEMREWSTFDMFPTTLAAMGFNIEGNRLALGTNMFSGEKTVCEILTRSTFDNELIKFSEFFLTVIAYPSENEE